ncbi:M15 family metallopeptidase [Armatimonas rosea]|uniref:D-alanyl-D-alanine dipeptidase n=1 Tax=Armatimonas rosea TaxID=685828 RepID=A0A7W9SQ95_ARMRO|nr:M15 family metallopeptidase [Armatimonas rosea]MBB6050214.1 D-alanyl-D-alanine dipeptidase [Armatimonas rosea]
MPEFDARSETNLATLRPKAQPHFRALLRALKTYATSHGLDVKIISANRTWAEQDALFAKGRTAPGPKVTNARGGQSNHNFQIAVDIGLFKDGKYLEESVHYDKMGPLGEALGLEWGGSWHDLSDAPHYQIKTNKKVSVLRELVRTQGWPAIDALIPTFVEHPSPVPAPTPSPAPTLDPVTVFLDHGDGAKKIELDAWFIESRVWVAIRDWTDYFGGSLLEKDGKYSLLLNDQSAAIKTQVINERTVAKFADINAVLGWNFSFNGAARPRTLTIHPDKD